MFLSFAAAAAAARGLSEIFIYENGVLSLNVPISDARKGTRSTHHAHPLYLDYFNQLINALFQRSFVVRNPFFFWTKREEVELLHQRGLEELIRESVSCWGYPNLTIKFPGSNHCGTCIHAWSGGSRRIGAGLESYDDRYVADALMPTLRSPTSSAATWKTWCTSPSASQAFRRATFSGAFRSS